MIPRYSVITTYERPNVALDCLSTLKAAGSDVQLIIDNGRNQLMPWPGDEATLTPYYLIRDDQQPVNLSQLWNLGLDWCQEDATRQGFEEWDVAILNDDTLLPAGWFTTVQTAMRAAGAAAACSGPAAALWKEPGPVPLHLRMTGWAFVLRGEYTLRADEQFHWWFGDSDLDYRSRQAGGMLMVPIGYVDNRYPNGYTNGDRQVRSHEDARLFAQQWGRLPY